MPYRPFEDQNCSIAAALASVGERWTLLVMREVLLGRRRFSEIRRNTGIAPNILSDRLQTLVDQDVLTRRLYAEHPESYEYLPTEKGRDLTPVILSLMAWGDRHATPAGGPPRVAIHTACGHDAQPELRCTHCDQALGRDVRMHPGPGANERQRSEGPLPA
jgi:DNA-binding HxlR family transcriptional regulator